eukprot:1830699-Rhodomonas_salina.1
MTRMTGNVPPSVTLKTGNVTFEAGNVTLGVRGAADNKIYGFDTMPLVPSSAYEGPTPIRWQVGGVINSINGQPLLATLNTILATTYRERQVASLSRPSFPLSLSPILPLPSSCPPLLKPCCILTDNSHHPQVQNTPAHIFGYSCPAGSKPAS